MQIMMLLTQQHARPDIPSVGSLPGGTWPGMQEYILLMQVCRRDCPCSSSAFLCNSLVLHCPRCSFDTSVYMQCVCVCVYICSVSVCLCACVNLCMCRCSLSSCVMPCYGSIVKVHGQVVGSRKLAALQCRIDGLLSVLSTDEQC